MKDIVMNFMIEGWVDEERVAQDTKNAVSSGMSDATGVNGTFHFWCLLFDRGCEQACDAHSCSGDGSDGVGAS